MIINILYLFFKYKYTVPRKLFLIKNKLKVDIKIMNLLFTCIFYLIN